MMSVKNLRWLLLLLFAMVAGAASAAGYSVSFQLVDSLGAGEPYATVRVYALPDTVRPAAMGVTDGDGFFRKPLGRPGEYRLTVTSVGKTPLAERFTLKKEEPAKELGRLTVRDAGNMLSEVTVTAAAPLISREIDRIGYDVQADDESKTSTLEETLRKVPMVNVDPDGTITLNGSSNFKIYKNGRPNNSFTRNAKDIFKSIPASTIKKIEVITDPGAREDAEGTGMILNIVTVENTVVKGVMGTANLMWDNQSNLPNPSVWLTSQIDRLTFSVFAGNWNRPSRSGGSSSSTRTDYASGNTLLESSSNVSRFNGTNAGLELSFEIDTLNLITAEFFGFFQNTKSRSSSSTRMMAGGSDDPAADIYRFDSFGLTNPSKGHWLDGTFNYQRSTRRKDEKITLSYMISGQGGRSVSDLSYTSALNMPVPYTGIYTDSRTSQLEHTLQLDWTRPLMKGHTFDTGAKYIYRDNNSRTRQDYRDYRTSSTDFSHITQVAALYADYRATFGKFGARAGVRYEYSRLAAEFKDGSAPDFHSNLNDWVPNAALSWTINMRNSMRLSYSSRISRPGINYLNPMVNTSPTVTSQGNPDLGSVRQQTLNLNYSFFSPKFNIDFNATYDFSNNDIIQVTDVIDDHTYNNYANAGRNRAFSAGAYIQWTASAKTRLMLNGSLRYNDYRNPSLGISAAGWSPSMFLRLSQKLPWKLQFNAMCAYWGRGVSLYNRPENKIRNAFYNLSLQRSFLKDDRLTVNIYARNPFGPSSREYSTRSINLSSQSYSHTVAPHNRSIGIRLSYRFGSLNATVRKVRGITNDDVVGGQTHATTE